MNLQAKAERDRNKNVIKNSSRGVRRDAPLNVPHSMCYNAPHFSVLSFRLGVTLLRALRVSVVHLILLFDFSHRAGSIGQIGAHG